MRRATLVTVLLLLLPTGSVEPVLAQDPDMTERLIRAYERPSRVEALQVDRVVDVLDPRPGAVVADLGAGSGLFTWPFARAVGHEGTVFAVEISPGMIAHIDATAREEGLENVVTVRAEVDDPLLPEPADLIFMAAMLHQVEEKAAYVRTLTRYVADGGRIAVLDMVRNWPTNPEMHYSVEDLATYMDAVGFTEVERYDFVDGFFFVVYGRSGP